MRISTYYTTIPSYIRQDKDLKPQAKLIFGDIANLAQKEGFCYASNAYIAGLANLDIRQVSRYVSELVNAGHIEREIKDDGTTRWLRILPPPVVTTPDNEDVGPTATMTRDPRQSCLDNNKTKNKENNKDVSFLDLVTSYFIGRGVSPIDAEDMAHGFLAWHEENDTTHAGVTPTKFKARANTWYQNAKRFNQIQVEAKVLTKEEFADFMRLTKQQNKMIDADEWELKNDHWHYTPTPKAK